MSKAHVLGIALAAELVAVGARAEVADAIERTRLREQEVGRLDLPRIAVNRAHAQLSIVGFASERGDQRELGALVSVTIPLDRLNTQQIRPKFEDPIAWIGDGESKPKAPGPSVPQTLPLELGRRVTPKVARACVRAAWRISGVMSDDDLLAMSSRARISAVLPEVGVRVSRGWDNSFRLLPTDNDPYRTQQVNGSSQWLEGRLTWKLDRALFADEEIPVERLRVRRVEERSRIATRVLRELFDWQKASMMERDPVLSSEEQLTAMVRRMEAEASLDVMTGGWFSEWVNARPEDQGP